PLVYEELRRLAAHYMRGERASHTLQPTALVNEMYLRIAGLDRLHFRDRAHFMAMAATIMRRVLVDHARDRGRGKRGGGVSVVSLVDQEVAAPDRGIDLVALDEALGRLAAATSGPRSSRARAAATAPCGPKWNGCSRHTIGLARFSRRPRTERFAATIGTMRRSSAAPSAPTRSSGSSAPAAWARCTS